MFINLINWEQMIPVLGAAVGIGMVAAGLGMIAMSGAEAVYTKVTGRISLKKLYKKEQQMAIDPVKQLKELQEKVQKNKDLINMSMLVLITGVACALLAPGTVLKVYGFSSGAGAGAFFYSIYQKQKKKGVRLKKLKEAILIYDAVNVYSETGENLPNILEKILPALDVLKPCVEKLLKRYPYNAQEAVLEMEKEMDFNEAGLLTSVLLQVITTGGHAAITASEGARMEDIRKTIFRTEIAVRPLYRQLVLFLPLGVGITMVLYALGRHVLNSLSVFNAGQFIK